MAESSELYLAREAASLQTFGRARGLVLGARGIACGAKGIPYDAKVEYLQGDGYAYIDTGISPTTDIIAEFGFQMAEASPSVVFVFGSDRSGSDNRFSLGSSTDGNYEIRISTYRQICSGYALTMRDIRLEAGTGRSYVDGVLVLTQPALSYPSEDPIPVFARRSSAGFSLISDKARFAYVRLITAGIIVIDMFAVRVGTVGYMYDTVSGTLFGNAASKGSFVLGPDV